MQIDQKTIKKYKDRDVRWLKAKAVEYFNRFVRLRDCDDYGFAVCMSCGKRIRYGTSECHAGHYIPGTCQILRFNEDNVQCQCRQCNYFKHGNQVEYRKNLIKKIGEERVKELEELQAYHKAHGHKWDRFTLIEKIETYKAKCKALKKQKMF